MYKRNPDDTKYQSKPCILSAVSSQKFVFIEWTDTYSTGEQNVHGQFTYEINKSY